MPMALKRMMLIAQDPAPKLMMMVKMMEAVDSIFNFQMLRAFLKDHLELVDYLIYTILLFLSFRKSRLVRYKVLFYYYLAATALLLEASIFYNMDNNWNYNLLFLVTIIVFSWYF